MKFFSAVAITLSSFLIAPLASAYSTIFVVRHAEKKDESKDPGLSDIGQKRAQSLASMLKDSGVSGIYTSEMLRTQKTAEPLAQSLKIKATVFAARDTNKLVKALKDDTSASAALVVGHSNTVPEIVKALGATQTITLGDDEYNRLFLLVPQKGAAPVLTTLTY